MICSNELLYCVVCLFIELVNDEYVMIIICENGDIYEYCFVFIDVFMFIMVYIDEVEFYEYIIVLFFIFFFGYYLLILSVDGDGFVIFRLIIVFYVCYMF